MIHTQTLEKLNQMKLYGMAETLQTQLPLAEASEMPATDLIGLLVDSEWLYRENKKMNRLVKGAQFKERSACLESLDYRSSRGLKKSTIQELSQNHWITHHQNILITGPAGSGKSFLAQALGHHATRHGYSVNYMRVPKLFFALLQSRADGSYLSYLRKIAKIKILILDDFALAPIGDQEKQDLMEIIEDRHKIGSTIITSQLPTTAWHAYMGGSLIAEGILDRLMHSVHRFDLKTVDSLRREDMKNLSLTDGGQSDK
jgi:DNA replication protein DnaC